MPKLVVDLRSYVVVRTWDPHGLLCVALVPRHVLKPPVPTSAKTGGPGQRRPTEVRMQAERSWYLCAYPASISNSVHTETWFARLEANCFGVTDAILVVRASGLYPRGALLQHSCDHNCVLAYDGATRRVTVRALRAVAAGDELTHACVSPGARDKI